MESLLRPSDTLSVQLTNKTHSIAIVTHRELACIFLLDSVRVLDALPITEHLLLAVAQTDSQTVASDLTVDAGSDWLLTIRRSAQDNRPLTFTVRTRNTQQIQSFTAECRRWKEIATETHPAGTDFSWIDGYVLDPPSRRLDLRLRKQPLHARLSLAAAGLPGDDILDISTVRRHWIERAAAKEASNGNVHHLKIRLGTFNVNGRSPSQDLYLWLRGTETKSPAGTGRISPLKLSPFEVPSDPFHQGLHEKNLSASTTDAQTIGDPDMLVLGFQELDLSTEALLYTTSTLKEDEWLTAIFAGLGEKHVLYEKLTSRQLVGILLIVIVKKALAPCFTNVRSCEAGSGIMGFMGNKGATAIRVEFTPKISSELQTKTYLPSVLTFVNAHLAASDEMIDRRNYDFQELSGRLAFPPKGLNENYPQTSFAGDTYSIYQSDVLFWMVHLNYRLDLPDGDIRKLLSSQASGIESIQTLLLYDQLRGAIRSNKAFSGFTEHPLTHFPTYRLALGVSRDRLGYDLKRKPAWTDRILYIASPDARVAQLAYRSHAEITMSDHQPISADFYISLPLIDQPQYESVVSTLHRELAGFEGSELRPKIKIQPVSIDLGTVRYKQAIHREVIIRNEGDIPCVFRFVGTGTDSKLIAPSWLLIEPMVGLLRPQDTATILLSVYVDNDSAAMLNLGPSMLECTLVLHTALGKDDFIAVSGYYKYTCFANTLERLTRLPGPISKITSPGEDAGHALSAPREVMRLINWLMAHVSAGDALWACQAQTRTCDIIRECLDEGDEFPSEGSDGHTALVAAFASTLVALLDSLTEPVVPARLHAQCVQVRDKDEAFEMLGAFPHASVNVWISLTAFLHYVVQQESNANANCAHQLASIFAPVLLRDDLTGVHPRASPVGKREFLLHFIT